MPLTGLMFPDILGTITENRIYHGKLQYSVGINPSAVRLNQPLELVVVLQSMVAENMLLRVNIRAPQTDAAGHPIVIKTDRDIIRLGLRPGEVGVLRVPVIPTPPTRPKTDYPLQIAIRYRLPKPDIPLVRPVSAGVKPKQLNISPFKLKALRDQVMYEAHPWHVSAESVTTHFTVLDATMPPIYEPPRHIYETLWSSDEMTEEFQVVSAALPLAQKTAATLDKPAVRAALCEHLPKFMQARGLWLNLAETRLLAALMMRLLAMPPAAAIESRWLATLAQVFAHYPETKITPPQQVIAQHLLEPLLLDALTMAEALLAAEQITLPERGDLFADTPGTLGLYAPLLTGALLLEPADLPNNPAALIAELHTALTERGRVDEDAAGVLRVARDLLKRAETRWK